MNEVEKAHAKLSKNAREWWEDFEQASSSVAAMEAAPNGEEFAGVVEEAAKDPANHPVECECEVCI